MPKRVRTHVNPLSILKKHSFDGFDNDNPIWVDVGACKGEFTEELATRFPDKNFLALEIRVPIAQKLIKRYESFSNIKVFDGDAGLNFKNILETSMKKGIKIEKIFINFPDPWFKERHKKRRFINAKFLEEIKDFFTKETEFIFQTDQQFLFEETIEVLNESVFSEIEYFDESPFGIKTDWEMAKEKNGDKIWRMKFRKESSIESFG